jgi:hypothetical protein
LAAFPWSTWRFGVKGKAANTTKIDDYSFFFTERACSAAISFKTMVFIAVLFGAIIMHETPHCWSSDFVMAGNNLGDCVSLLLLCHSDVYVMSREDCVAPHESTNECHDIMPLLYVSKAWKFIITTDPPFIRFIKTRKTRPSSLRENPRRGLWMDETMACGVLLQQVHMQSVLSIPSSSSLASTLV